MDLVPLETVCVATSLGSHRRTAIWTFRMSGWFSPRVHDAHGLGGDADDEMHLFLHLVDVHWIGFFTLAVPFGLLVPRTPAPLAPQTAAAVQAWHSSCCSSSLKKFWKEEGNWKKAGLFSLQSVNFCFIFCHRTLPISLFYTFSLNVIF